MRPLIIRSAVNLNCRVKLCEGPLYDLCQIYPKWAVTCDFQQCGILTSVDSEEPVQLPIKLRISKNDVQSVA